MSMRSLVWGCAGAASAWMLLRAFGRLPKKIQNLGRIPVPSSMNQDFAEVPVINMGPFVGYTGGPVNEAQKQVAKEIGIACRQVGFFYITGHGVPDSVTSDLEQLARNFYALPLEEKMKSAIVQSGKAMRGYFNVGGEKTGGLPDQKEGFYFSRHITDENDPMWKEEAHGPNIYPERPEGLGKAVDTYMNGIRELAQSLLCAVCISLGLPPNYFRERYTADPFIFFALLFYPNRDSLKTTPEELKGKWGVGPHTDYGVLTILKQDTSGGLEVRNGANQWIPAPPIPGTFVVNIGDMLEKMTGGLYRSTLHRVVTPPRERAPNGRISFPFFFDPNFNARITPIQLSEEDAAMLEVFKAQRAGDERWDKLDLISLEGVYGDYVKQKALAIFPANFDAEKKKKMMR